MNHAETILRALDRHLTCETHLVLYGRAALVLGFDDPPSEAAASLDVDIILPLDQAAALDVDFPFWDSLEAANAELSSAGLYVTHLFAEDQVILRPEWRQHLVPIALPGLHHLRLSRPHALDLLLTKTMRGADPQDMADADFLVRQAGVRDLRQSRRLEIVSRSKRQVQVTVSVDSAVSGRLRRATRVGRVVGPRRLALGCNV